MKFEYIEIPDNMIKDEWWDEIKGRFHYSGHSHFNSPFETDNSCGNCDGAKCDICKKITEPDHYSAAIPCDELEKILAKVVPELPEELRRDLVYDDCKNYVDYNDTRYRIKWPKKEIAK